MFNAAKGSILLPALCHFQLNNPVWPDAQPYDSYLFAAVALAVVWLNRTTMLARAGVVTEVVPAQVAPSGARSSKVLLRAMSWFGDDTGRM